MAYAGVIVIDLDRFQSLNERFGPDVGDQVLIEAADRLCQKVGSWGTVAHNEGDEFITAVGGPGAEDFVMMAQKFGGRVER